MHDATRNRVRGAGWRALALALALAPGGAFALERPAQTPLHTPPSGVVGVRDAYFSPEFWVARLQDPDQVLMPRAAIDARNLRLLRAVSDPWPSGD